MQSSRLRAPPGGFWPHVICDKWDPQGTIRKTIFCSPLALQHLLRGVSSSPALDENLARPHDLPGQMTKSRFRKEMAGPASQTWWAVRDSGVDLSWAVGFCPQASPPPASFFVVILLSEQWEGGASGTFWLDGHHHWWIRPLWA